MTPAVCSALSFEDPVRPDHKGFLFFVSFFVGAPGSPPAIPHGRPSFPGPFFGFFPTSAFSPPLWEPSFASSVLNVLSLALAPSVHLRDALWTTSSFEILHLGLPDA